MNWKFWKRNEDFEPEFEITSENLPISTLFRWYCYDTGVKNPNQFADDFGLNPISEEGEEFELKESEARLARLIPYVPFLNILSEINAAVLAQTLTNVLTKYDVLEEDEIEKEQELMEDIYRHITLGGLTAAFSAALSLGIIVNPGSFITEVDADEF